MGGTMTISVAERLVKGMIQVQIASRMNSQLRMSVVHPSHIMSAKQQSASKKYDQRLVLTKEQINEEMLHDKTQFTAHRLYDHIKNWEQIYGIPTNKPRTYDERLLEMIRVYCALTQVMH
jgi:hypothetical protein